MQKLITSISLSLICITLYAQEVQWASKVVEFSSQNTSTRGSAKQALSKPNIYPQGGQTDCAWKPGNQSKKEFIHVEFTKPQKAQQVIIAENYKSSMIAKVTILSEKGKEQEVYKGKPYNTGRSGKIRSIKFNQTSYLVKGVKVYCNNTPTFGKSEIDAIGIADHQDEYVPKINLEKDIVFDEKPENLGRNVNTSYGELLPVISPDGKSIYYSIRNSPQNIGGQPDDIYYSHFENGNWTPKKNIGKPLNNSSYNSPITILPDGNTLILMNVYKPNGTMAQGLSVTYKTKTGWSFPQKLEIKNFYNDNDYYEFCMSSNGKVILMTVERADTEGEKDIYVSFRNSDATWTEPKNIGANINTASNESSPFLAADNKTLYFSSKGLPGYGDNDIYVTRRLDDSWTNWSEPTNLGPTINTPDWDAYFTIPASGQYAYLVSAVKNDQNIGGSDILRVKLPKELRPEPVVLVKGKVINKKTGQPIEASITYETLPGGIEAGIAKSNPVDGKYQIVLPYGNLYGFLGAAKGYIAINENLDTRKITEYGEIERDIQLVPIEVGQVVRLNNIFFDFGKASIREESYPELNRVVKFLKKNNQVVIRIDGHTDNVGADAANLKLSQERAAAVSDYVIKQGISSSQISSKGFGETQPVATNDTDEGKQLNRRVEFTILKTE